MLLAAEKRFCAAPKVAPTAAPSGQAAATAAVAEQTAAGGGMVLLGVPANPLRAVAHALKQALRLSATPFLRPLGDGAVSARFGNESDKQRALSALRKADVPVFGAAVRLGEVRPHAHVRAHVFATAARNTAAGARGWLDLNDHRLIEKYK